jgi:hypothetical protein
LEFYGFSLPENATEFYEPVIWWLKELKTELEDKHENYNVINVIFKMVYYNSASLRQLMEIFHILSEIYHAGFPVQISWQYDSEDPQMAESGKEIGDIIKVPVNVLAYN